MYEDEFELTFDLSGLQPDTPDPQPEPVPEPEAEPAPRPQQETSPAEDPHPEVQWPAENGQGVLISGGDRGIGAAAARAFYAAGYRVAVLYHTHAAVCLLYTSRCV